MTIHAINYVQLAFLAGNQLDFLQPELPGALA
ncbi:MAG: hypothetical protein JWR68_2845 [Polaromonas sp.]|nr:hypothetical protein [Polaromonas sp.]